VVLQASLQRRAAMVLVKTMQTTLDITSKIKEQGEYLIELGKILSTLGIHFRFRTERNIYKDGYYPINAEFILGQGISISGEYIVNDRIKVGELYLCAISDDDWRKLQINKAIDRISKTIKDLENTVHVFSGLENISEEEKFIIPILQDIYDDVLVIMAKQYPQGLPNIIELKRADK
jgi:hypothetical protein